MTGKITGPRELDMDYPQFSEPEELAINREMLVAPGDDRLVQVVTSDGY